MIIIGSAVLLFVIGTDFTGQSLAPRSTEIAVINGEDVTPRDWDARIQTQIDDFKQRSGQPTLDDRTMDFIRTQVWNQLKEEIVLGIEFDKLGISVSADELENMTTGRNPHPQVAQVPVFRDASGRFNPALVMQYMQNMDNDVTGQQKADWLSLEKGIEAERIRSKYTSMVKQGMYVTNEEVQANLVGNSKLASIKYLVKDYRSIADDAVEVTDADIKSYYNSHVDDYTQEASRTVKCVVFNVDPSDDDKQKVSDWINEIKVEFAASTDDSLYVNINADSRYFGIYNTKGELPLSIDSIMFESEVGYVSDVFIEGRAYNVAKLINKKFAPDSANARYIYIGSNDNEGTRSKEEAKVFADSILQLINVVGVDFTEMAVANSDDQNKEQGGEIGWFREGMQPKIISDFCFDMESETGKPAIVEIDAGYLIIELTDRTEPVNKVQVGIIDRELGPSNATFQALFTKSSEFAGKNKKAEDFLTAIESEDLAPLAKTLENIKKGDRSLGGIEGSREVVKWINAAEEGDVSTAIEIGESYLVVLLEDIYEDGNTPLEKIKTEVESAARKEKKAEMLIEELTAALSESGTVDGAATKLSVDVKTATGVTFASNSIPTVGNEPALVGTIFGLSDGQTSKPIKGENGVYIVMLEAIQELVLGNPNTSKSILSSGAKSKADYLLIKAILDNAEVTDNRSEFY